MQISGFQSTDFLGVGTVKGEHNTHCGDSYGTSWTAYADGFSFGTYFCNLYGTVSDTASDVRATIQYMNCNGVNRWGIYFEGDLKLCKTIDATVGRGGAGGESFLSDFQQVDIYYHDMEYRTSTGTWNPWSQTVAWCEFRFLVDGSDTAFWVLKQ